MKIKSVIFSVIAFVVLSVSTAWAAETPKPGTKSDQKIARDAANRLCEELTPLVAKALSMSYEGKDEAEIKRQLLVKWQSDEKADKFYPKTLSADAWIAQTVTMTKNGSKDVMRRFPGNKDIYAQAVYAGEATYLASCQDSFTKAFMERFKESRQ